MVHDHYERRGYLTRPEVEAVINAPDPKTWTGRCDRALFAFLYNTGARVSEAIDLRAEAPKRPALD